MAFLASTDPSLLPSVTSNSASHTDTHLQGRPPSSLSFSGRGRIRRNCRYPKHLSLHNNSQHGRHARSFVIFASSSSSSSSAGNHINNNKLDELAALLISLSQTTGQFFESSWLQTVDFFRSYDLQRMIKQGFFAANQKIEEIGYDARKSAEQLNRRFRLSERAREMAEFANQKMKNIDQQYGLVQKFRNASTDFRRNIPMVCMSYSSCVISICYNMCLLYILNSAYVLDSCTPAQ